MKKFTLIALIVLTVILLTGTSYSENITIEKGTEVFIRSAEKLKSNNVKPEQVIRFIVERPVTNSSGFVLIERGANAYGKILKAASAGVIGAKGSLSFSVDSVEAFNGKIIPLTGNQDKSGKSARGAAIIGSIFLTPVALLFRGVNAVIDTETIYTVYVAETTVLFETEEAVSDEDDKEVVDMLEIYQQRKKRQQENKKILSD